MLTSQQEQIVRSSIPRFIVEAHPGSGKTRILVEKIINAIKKGQYLPQQIVAITFTEKAAQEIKNRIKNTQVWISTIHGLCHRILKENINFMSSPGLTGGLPFNFSVLSSEQILFLQHKAIQKGIKQGIAEKDESMHLLLSTYGFSKVESLLFSLFAERYIFKKMFLKVQKSFPESENFGARELFCALGRVFKITYEIYENLKKERHACDFEDLLEKTLALLQTNESILKTYQKHFKMILVDEFQDTNDIQKELIELLNPVSLMVVGDPKQAIYRFRGADVDLFYDVKKDIVKNEGFCFELVENFRSSPLLIQFVNALFESSSVSPYGDYTQDSQIEYAHCKGTSSLEGRKKEAQCLASHIKEMRKKIPLNEIALLFRAMTFTSIYEQALKQEGIPCVRKDLGFLYETREVKSLTALLKWFLNPQDDFSFWMFIQWFTPEKAATLAKERKKQNTSFYALIFQKPPGRFWASYPQGLRICLQKMKLMKERISLVEWFYLLPQSLMSENEIIRKFLKIVRDFEAQNKDFEWKYFLEYIEVLQRSHISASEAEEETSKEGVQLLTIHQSKGLEFEAVYIPDLSYLPRKDSPLVLIDKKSGIGLKVPGTIEKWEEDSIYSSIKAQEIVKDKEESKRLFYVALTRAKRYLVLSHGSEKPKPSSWAGWLESSKEKLAPFWKESEF